MPASRRSASGSSPGRRSEVSAPESRDQRPVALPLFRFNGGRLTHRASRFFRHLAALGVVLATGNQIAGQMIELSVKAIDQYATPVEGIRFTFNGVESWPTTASGVTALSVPKLAAGEAIALNLSHSSSEDWFLVDSTIHTLADPTKGPATVVLVRRAELTDEKRVKEGGRGSILLMNQEDVTRAWYSGSYALLIGVSKYTTGWDDLPSIPSELAEVEAELRRHGFQVTKHLNPTAAALEEHLKQFINEHGLSLGNRLLFYYSGHGSTRTVGRRQKGYLVPSDAPLPHNGERAFLRKAFPISDLVQWSKSRIEAKHALFLFDS